jgi:hypothetical protein
MFGDVLFSFFFSPTIQEMYMKALIVLTTLNLAVSGATLAVVIVGGRKVKAQVESVKINTFAKIRTALTALED